MFSSSVCAGEIRALISRTRFLSLRWPQALLTAIPFALALPLSPAALASSSSAPNYNSMGTGSYASAHSLYSASFDKADIKEFIRTVSANLNRTIIIDPAVRGEVTIRAYEQLNRQQYYQMFLSVLSVHGFAAVEDENGLVKIIPDKNARTSSIPVVAGKKLGEQVAHGGDEMVTWVLPVNHVPVRELSPILRQLVDNSGSVVHYDPSNILILSGRANNLERVAEVVRRVDQAGMRNIQIVQLFHASASEMERILMSIYAGQGQKANGMPPVIVSNEASNQIILSADTQTLQRMKSLLLQMDAERKSTGNIRVFYLHYAKAEDLKKVLDGVGKMLIASGNRSKSASGDYSIEVHEQTNALVVTARPDVMQAMESVIEQLDIRRAQVMVEAIIVEVADGDGINLSFQLANADGTSLMQFQDGSSVPIGEILMGMKEAEGEKGSTVVTTDPNTGQLITTTNPDKDGDYTALAAALAKVSGAAFSITSGDWTALLQAVTTSSQSNVLATPSLLTLDNEEASFIVGDEVPTLTGSTPSSGNDNPYQTIERKEVGVKLTVTPQINAGDAVKLTIEQEVSSVNGRTPVDVTFATRKVKTSVMVKTGDTVVIGGLLDENVQESVSKVPLLGDIPVLGHLFRSTSSKKVKKNLMVFLRPTIIRDDLTMNAISGQKYDLIRAYQLDRQARGISLMPGFDTPVLPEQPTARDFLDELRRQMDEESAEAEKAVELEKASTQASIKPVRRTGGER
ncbi:type II secretion system secretin GspD [Salinisphaera sp. G21_0]|uniref:type II secretion system secretin GspD n=1 Tax=Salinisphaera sp. G21_0 TaxID=2821094 RepID=UPI001ADB6D79|nr:type II secretion system secretin GspD [Salinisphaera sp. G21_0]MBO9482803.1 type II secretion system secretin GspD [Salinisphaera sp. G21_0]